MPTLQEIMDTQKQLEASLGSRMAHFEKMLQPSSSSVSDVNQSTLVRDFTEFRQFVMDMFKLLRTQIDTLATQVDDIDNQSRRNALLFHGLPEEDNENCTSTISHIIKSKMNHNSFQDSSIYLCHRLGSKNMQRARPIIVRFTDIQVRNVVWNAKKALKSSPIVLGEFLTKKRHDVFLAARKHFGTSSWTSNGSVFIKTPDNTRIRVSTASDLEVLISKYPMVSVNSGSSGVPARARSNASPKPASPAVEVPPMHARRNQPMATRARLNK